MRWGDSAAGRAAGGIGPGDHACCAFGSGEEQRAVVARYAAEAFDRGERVAYLGDTTGEPALLELLGDAGIDAGARRDAGQLRHVDIEGSYLAGGSFDADRQAGLLGDMARDARADGFAGLGVVAEMTWALREPGLERELLAYERAVNRVFADGALHALCQYDRRAFSGETVALARLAHGVAIDTAGAGGTTTVRRGPFTVREDDEQPLLELAGEADFFAAPYLAARLADATERAGDDDVVVDARELRFADVAASRVIVEAARRLPEDRRLRVEHARPGPRRVLALCGWLQDPQLELA